MESSKLTFRTMLVEDSLNFRKVLRDTLQDQFPSVEIIEAGSGDEAIKKVASQPVDLIFMDINLPGKNGLRTTKEIRADYPNIPVAVLTGYDSPEYQQAAIEKGASCFIDKGAFKWEEIFTIVNCFQNAKQNGRVPACVQGLGCPERS
jgi:DNA-binding NarL/FixJ family response regulator